MALRDVLQAIQAAVAKAMPSPGFSTVAASAGATGTVLPSGTPQGTFSVALTVIATGATGTATGQLSLDGGNNYGPVFTLPATPYTVPLDDTMAGPSGLVLSFSGTFHAGETYSFTASVAPTFYMGEEYLSELSVFPRVVWIPDGDDWGGTEQGAGYPGGTQQDQTNTARQLAMAVTRIEAHIWGLDYTRTQLLRDQVINGVLVGAPSPSRLLPGHWTRFEGATNRAGREYVLSFQFKAPVLELTPSYSFASPPFVEVLTQEIDMPDGTSQQSTS